MANGYIRGINHVPSGLSTYTSTGGKYGTVRKLYPFEDATSYLIEANLNAFVGNDERALISKWDGVIDVRGETLLDLVLYLVIAETGSAANQQEISSTGTSDEYQIIQAHDTSIVAIIPIGRARPYMESGTYYFSKGTFRISQALLNKLRKKFKVFQSREHDSNLTNYDSYLYFSLRPVFAATDTTGDEALVRIQNNLTLQVSKAQDAGFFNPDL
jgi:hypothetical protein